MMHTHTRTNDATVYGVRVDDATQDISVYLVVAVTIAALFAIGLTMVLSHEKFSGKGMESFKFY